MPIHIEGADALIAKLSGIAAALLPAAAEGMGHLTSLYRCQLAVGVQVLPLRKLLP